MLFLASSTASAATQRLRGALGAIDAFADAAGGGRSVSPAGRSGAVAAGVDQAVRVLQLAA